MCRVLVIMIIGLQFFYSQDAMTQTGQVFLHTDKTIGYPGDTVWFRGYLLMDSGYIPSTNFIVELYDDTARLVTRKTFPVNNGAAFGQVEISSSPGLYWLRAYTLSSANEAIQSLTVVEEGKSIVTRTMLTPKGQLSSSNDPIDFRKDSNGYVIRLADTVSTNYSLAVVDRRDPGNLSNTSFIKSPQNGLSVDTSYISFEASVQGYPNTSSSSSKPELVMMLQKDSILSPPQLLPVDSNANISLSGLYFFDTAYIYYKLNDKKGNIQLLLHPNPYPEFIPPPVRAYRSDTFDLRVPVVTDSFLSKPEYLKAVVVKGQWKDRHRALNKRYVISPEFAAVEQFTYDLRDSSLLRRFSSVLDFVYGELPQGWAQNSLLWSQCREGVQYYVDEKIVPGEMVQSEPLRNFAYCKVFTDLHPPCPCICLYTRKGNDLKVLPSSMNILAIKGYDRPLTWQTPDKITLHWNPYINTKSYRFNVPAENFQIRVAGVMASGEIFSCEKAVVNGAIQ